MNDLSGILAEHPYLAGLSEEHLQFLTGCASNAVMREGEFLFREGGPADRIYLIRFGQVALQAYAPGKGATTIATAAEGEVVGWSWIVQPYKAHFDALALTTVRAVALDAECLRRKCEEDHELGYQMLRRTVDLMERRVQATRIQLLDLYGSTA